jgi:hypothetical protein
MKMRRIGEPVSVMGKLMRRLGAPIYSYTSNNQNQKSSGLRRRRITRKRKRVTKKRVSKKKNGVHSRRIM